MKPAASNLSNARPMPTKPTPVGTCHITAISNTLPPSQLRGLPVGSKPASLFDSLAIRSVRVFPIQKDVNKATSYIKTLRERLGYKSLDATAYLKGSDVEASRCRMRWPMGRCMCDVRRTGKSARVRHALGASSKRRSAYARRMPFAVIGPKIFCRKTQ